MHRRSADSRNAFLAETDNFKAILGKVIAADIMKASVNELGEVLRRRVPHLD